MYPTAEIRWFYSGQIPAAVEAWFEAAAGRLEREAPRTDRYLRPRGKDGVNVKLRQGRIEIKQRVGALDIVRLHEDVTGVAERWRKWSFRLADPAGEAANAPSPASAWAAVRKDRRVRVFEVTSQREVVSPTTSETPAQGCELELTEVQVAGRPWWTVAFEAFGREGALRDNLLLVARHVFGRDGVPQLESDHSEGYAAWLARILERKETARWAA